MGKNFGQASGAVSVDQIEQLAATSFPLCMTNVHNFLKETKHAKHWARLQYGLFLKAIGLNSDDALVFWKKYLTKNCGDGDAFDKKYSYLFRHMYGKEGKKTSYSAYSCVKIQNSNAPGTADEFHGCPYKHNPVNILQVKLDKLGLHKTEINEVLDFVSSKNYCMACTKEFEFRHKVAENMFTSITHPNQYYEESVRFSTTGNVSNRMRGVQASEAVPLDSFVQEHETFVASQRNLSQGGDIKTISNSVAAKNQDGVSDEDMQFLDLNAAEFEDDF